MIYIADFKLRCCLVSCVAGVGVAGAIIVLMFGG